MENLLDLFAPWAGFVEHHHALSATLVGLHLMALVIGGGVGIAADWNVLRVRPGDMTGRLTRREDIAAVHRVVLAGVTVLFATGVLITASELDEFLETPVFWIKLVLVALLVVNGAMMTRREKLLPGRTEAAYTGDGEWGRVRLHAIFSLVLWIATAVAGLVLSYVA
ncbi:MAG: hypothetical protein LBG44_04735 [Gemmatimonadota bacterium]|jgi:hypothetical protein|nr:hypothetical protein [Gemmatimonadota bacterium]